MLHSFCVEAMHQRGLTHYLLVVSSAGIHPMLLGQRDLLVDVGGLDFALVRIRSNSAPCGWKLNGVAGIDYRRSADSGCGAAW